MNVAVRRVRQFLLTVLFLVAAVWCWGEGAQWLLRIRAEHLLADIRSLNPGQSTWSDAQRVIARWSGSGTAMGPCNSDHCRYEIDLLQTLPHVFVGDPAPGAHNWIARVAGHMGLRSAAARAGVSVREGVLTSMWFGEQVTVPIRDWGAERYVPYLSVSARESGRAHEAVTKVSESFPMRLVRHGRLQTDISFSAGEPPANRAAFFDFRLGCITRLRPCETQTDILPEGLKLLQQK